MAIPAVEVKGLCRTFKTKAVKGKSKTEIVKALQDVDITIHQGELFGLLGPNGAGKTTLIKILCTLLLPSSGDAKVLGHDVEHETQAIRQKINMVSGGETSGYGLLTVRENLWLFSQLYGMPTKIANNRIDALLEVLELEHKKNSKVRTLSTGLRQKANMIRGFMTDPALIFLDEPTLGLDVNASRLTRDFIKGWMKAKPDRTVLLTTHYMMEAEELCDRVAIINDGKVLACDTPANLKKLINQDTTLKSRDIFMDEDSIKEKTTAGAVISLINALLGIVLVYVSFLAVYETIMESEMAAGRAGGDVITDGISVSEFVMPGVNDIVLIGGALWAMAAFGFIRKEKWAWPTAMAANVLSLLSFFMLIPAMSRGISPIYTFVFVPNIIAFFLLLTYVRKIDKKIIAISTVAGMAYVMSFMNGVAATDQLLSEGELVFLIGQRLSWVGAFAWAGFVIALLNRKKYTIQLGLFAALISLIAGLPPAFVTSIDEAKFSMFFLAPILSLLLKIIF